MKIENVRYKLTGIGSKYLMFYNGESQDHPDPKAPPQGFSQEQIAQIVEYKAYRGGDGELVFPAGGIRTALRDAAGTLKVKVSGKNEYLKSMIKAYVLPCEDWAQVIDNQTGEPFTEYEIDVRYVYNKKAKARLKCWRPKVYDWSIEVTLQVDVDQLSPNALLEHFQRTGIVIGIGSFRPQNSGTFGRFEAELLV